MYIKKVLRLLGIVIASLALVTMIVSASGNLLSSSFAQGGQNFTAKMTDKEEVVGVHSPEFTFEKNYANVKDAVQRFGITYPVILDSDHGTWNAYANNYWPRYYLIDTQGYIRYDHIGEGSYDQIEKAIQSLVAERAALMGAKEISFDANPTAPIKPGVCIM
jgi:hypothetical protein